MHIVFVSSTSVYGDVTGEVNEVTEPQPSTLSAKQLLESEQLIKNTTENYTIIRFAGLIGNGRHLLIILKEKLNYQMEISQ